MLISKHQKMYTLATTVLDSMPSLQKKFQRRTKESWSSYINYIKSKLYNKKYYQG